MYYDYHTTHHDDCSKNGCNEEGRTLIHLGRWSFGIALFLPNLLAGYAAPAIVLGFAAHGIGMARKHSLEQETNRPRAKWMGALYWFCWLALAALLVYVVIRAIG